METRKNDNRKLWGTFGSVAAIGILYFLLLGSDHNVFSIAVLHHFILHAPSWEARLIVFFIPIYFAVMVFGGGVVGWIAGLGARRVLQHAISRESIEK